MGEHLAPMEEALKKETRWWRICGIRLQHLGKCKELRTGHTHGPHALAAHTIGCPHGARTQATRGFLGIYGLS